ARGMKVIPHARKVGSVTPNAKRSVGYLKPIVAPKIPIFSKSRLVPKQPRAMFLVHTAPRGCTQATEQLRRPGGKSGGLLVGMRRQGGPRRALCASCPSLL